MTTPRFVVVGNVNQGKSSVVAALAENTGVPIARHSGTTTRSGCYACRIDGHDVFELIDTPGFQDARRALQWMRERAPSPAERAGVVAEFVRAHRGGDEFRDEVELLGPVLEGAGILYVVDASARFQPANEAEMEILRWTGEPGMALINRTRERDFAGEWRPILEQFFNIVREFDAHHATFGDRLALLHGFREVRAAWRAPLDAAIDALQRDWERRQRQAAAVIAELMVANLTHVEKIPLAEDEPEPPARERLAAAYREAQREGERRARDTIQRLYRLGDLARSEATLDLLATDLFSATSWRLFGLSRGQLAKYGAAWGAAAGGAVDLMVGGLSFLAGAGIGAGIGALAGYFGGTEVARTWGSKSKLARILFPGDTGRFLYMGPVTSPRYAWMLLDRALVHYRAVRDRSHARDGELALRGDGVVEALPTQVRNDVDAALRRVLQQTLSGHVAPDARAALEAALRGCTGG